MAQSSALTSCGASTAGNLAHGADVACVSRDLATVWSMALHTVVPRLAIGAASGLAATGPMTLAMLGMQEFLPKSEQYSLPPRRIVTHLASWLGIRRDLDKQSLDALTAVAHFAYGASAGALYGPLGLALPVPGVVSGVGWGLLVWAGSYLGLLPTLNLLSSATHHPRKRSALMIAAHVVWGASLGFLSQRIDERMQRN
ncbi:MAG TPA: DUF6789 family protein [Ktedonobacterales bacterium]